jgi:hypothetical protein
MPHDAHRIPPEGGPGEPHHSIVGQADLGHPPTEANDLMMPWHVADTAPQPVVEPDTMQLPDPTGAELAEYARNKMHRRVDFDTSEEKPLSHRGQPKHRFSRGKAALWTFGVLVIAAWLFIVYQLGINSVGNRPQPVRTVTETPAAKPGPRVTVRAPGAPRVVTRTRRSTVRATVTRTVPGPTVTVTSPAPDIT